MRRSDAECANLETSVDPIEGLATDPFAGQYITTWLEDHKPRQARLSIAVRPGATGIYTVTWTAFNHTTLFWGEAMIAGDLLIGDYRNFDPF
ncbi:hypothetical protein [Chitinophaga sp. Ak27]|uniref:hypothetical protein n=1 Tax=Chitinophaga sp. Ak27 TaxID=2726116 RepID=UPI00145C449D|nr:hypothetical protein [Chitinophaga sp. Ak27]NLU94879.1 hypothetical protein [Chitinophaga sp. Ak27]